jgi:hypothetical protein
MHSSIPAWPFGKTTLPHIDVAGLKHPLTMTRFDVYQGGETFTR